MKKTINIIFKSIFWLSLLAGYMWMIKNVIDYDKLITDCTARDTFEINGERYICIQLEKM